MSPALAGRFLTTASPGKPTLSLLIKNLILLDQGPTFMISFNLHYILTANTVTRGISASTHAFCGDAFQSITAYM